jgi:hypothetical protein
VGIQVPEIKLPNRQSKDKPTQEISEVTVVSANGSLRRLAEKDLLMQVTQGVIRFRLLKHSSATRLVIRFVIRCSIRVTSFPCKSARMTRRPRFGQSYSGMELPPSVLPPNDL